VPGTAFIALRRSAQPFKWEYGTLARRNDDVPVLLPFRFFFAHRVFGYLFDFGDEWLHQVQVERIEQAIPTVTYPRVIKRVGKSPPP